VTEHLEAGRGLEARAEVAVNLEKADQAGAATVGDRAGCDRRASFNLVESGGKGAETLETAQAGAATVGDRAGCDKKALSDLVESGGGVGMQGEEGISDLVESGG
jgi:hypothetical protein